MMRTVVQVTCWSLVAMIALASSSFATSDPQPKAKVTPKMMYSLDLKKDEKKWGLGSKASVGNVFIMELVTEGQSMQTWSELVTNMVVLEQQMGEYVSKWQQLLMKKVPGLYMDEEILSDQSMIVRYRSADESGVWRFTQGADGVYALCYVSKTGEGTKERVKFWENLIKSSPLIPRAKM